MHKKLSNTIWGVVFIIIGICIALRVLFGWQINIFFPGWWTLAIIIPCAVGVKEKGFGSGNGIGLLIGIFFFLGAQRFIPFGMLFKLFIPVLLVAIGVNILFRGIFNESKNVTMNVNRGLNDYVGIFSNQKITYPAEKFVGCTVNAVFGTVDVDLRNAIIDEDIIIEATSIFGGIDLLVPPNIRVKVSNVPLFGSVRNRTSEPIEVSAPTIFVNTICMFGGVDIK